MSFVDTKDLEVREPLPGWAGRFLNTQHMTFGYYDVVAGSSIHEHAHLQEEVWHVIEGALEVTIDGETVAAKAGCIAIVPPHATHSVRALVDSRAIVVDTPVRDSIGGVKTER